MHLPQQRPAKVLNLRHRILGHLRDLEININYTLFPCRSPLARGSFLLYFLLAIENCVQFTSFRSFYSWIQWIVLKVSLFGYLFITKKLVSKAVLRRRADHLPFYRGGGGPALVRVVVVLQAAFCLSTINVPQFANGEKQIKKDKDMV